jgi:tRNA pseudouridine65 synthase
MEIAILAESSDWVVVGKPTGLAVHRGEETNDPTYAVQEVRDLVGRRVWPVHRLDRGTSGCLWMAFSPDRLAEYGTALSAGSKRYLAQVRGAIVGRESVRVERPMKDTRGVMREAATTARCVGSSADPRCSLVLAEPHTGRFHQVRRHLRDLSHPVLGDGIHGDSRINRWWREERGLGRLALHCLSLSIDLPGGPLRVSCPIPEDLRSVWSVLPWWGEAVATVPELA